MDIYKILESLAKVEGKDSKGSMASATKHPIGPKFFGYWKGKDKGTPGKHMVGGAMEEAVTSIEKELEESYQKFLSEYGADLSGGTAGGTVTAPGIKAPTTPGQEELDLVKQTSQAKSALQKLKQVGVGDDSTITTGAATQIATNPQDAPSKLPAQQRKVVDNLGKSLQNAIHNASEDPQVIAQITQALKKANMTK